MRKFKLSTFLFLLSCCVGHAQMEEYSYKREIIGVTEQWQKITLPDDIFGKVSNDLSDIRIFGIRANCDTLEAPYILNVLSSKLYKQEIAFNTLNSSHNKNGYFFTFEVPSEEAINQMNLQFEQQNFDWSVQLQGSQNQQEWFTILNEYRILSIKNQSTDFQFTRLTFPSSKFRFFRIHINSKKKPDLNYASITAHQITDGELRDCPIKSTTISENKAGKQTEIEVDLECPMPVSLIKINVENAYDYYRPITVKFLADSVKTEQGWIYNYRSVASGLLHSLGENELSINSQIVQRLKLIVHNQDNKPLSINSIHVQGFIHELKIRFDEPATYYLTYGNKKATYPNYDINRFTSNIPETIPAVQLGNELSIEKAKVKSTEALFKNQIWLWIIITALVLLLGWFSLGMIRRKTGEDM